MYRICASSDVGKKRKINEDHFLVGNYIGQDKYEFETSTPMIVAITDGVGGEKKGEIASKIALEELCKFSEVKNPKLIKSHILKIHNLICQIIKNNHDYKGMSTTLTGVLCHEEKLTPFNIGDSRVYRYRKGFLKQLTEDHTLVNELYRTGAIKFEEMITHPDKNIILQFLGGNCDVIPVPEILPTIFSPLKGDILLLCSDGLSDMVSIDDLEEILSLPNEHLSKKVSKLIQTANNNGGYDNITIICVEKC